MLWLKKLNFMETAKLEMELMKAFEAGENLDAKIQSQADLAASTKDPEQAWKLDVWKKMLVRIRKMQTMMSGESQPKP
ncbi:hypothetical protein KR100_12235 [Synechococcus sp. KORDI-100]|uniref:hypothetical protein n=1 Tax=Synechococcus sp. KORDI-100 TaxID=1280380 RepID=UPI0004E0937D|nr:hypothetical protein [Synechococcus sp. KORDI-100]AII44119.1 hypothetical protein KR100_12235 [Synechococcus sp. KORDI-100]